MIADDCPVPTPDSDGVRGPLGGMRVLELGSFIAGPFATQLLGDYGADIIKIEAPPHGDPMRAWGVTIDGESLWWPTIARNKRSVAVDLRLQAGQEVVRRLAASCDLVIENFRSGRLSEWGLDHAALSKLNPRLVTVHISGFGQSGPKSTLAGFGSIGEAVGGIRYTTGSPDRPPARTGVSLGDSLAALFGVAGGLAAYSYAQRTGRGQEVDVAIYEAVFALMESTLADYELAGVIRQRTGAVLPGVAPSNAYLTADGSHIVIAANADSVFTRLCAAMRTPELAEDASFATHIARGRNAEELDQIITNWTSSRTTEEVLEVLDTHAVPCGRTFTAPDMLADPHFAARGMLVRQRSSQGWDVPMSGVVPAFSVTPGSIRDPGPVLGQHTQSVLSEIGMSREEILRLVDHGVVVSSPDPRMA